MPQRIQMSNTLKISQNKVNVHVLSQMTIHIAIDKAITAVSDDNVKHKFKDAQPIIHSILGICTFFAVEKMLS